MKRWPDDKTAYLMILPFTVCAPLVVKVAKKLRACENGDRRRIHFPPPLSQGNTSLFATQSVPIPATRTYDWEDVLRIRQNNYHARRKGFRQQDSRLTCSRSDCAAEEGKMMSGAFLGFLAWRSGGMLPNGQNPATCQ